jgi:CspA family cold shock protein
MAGAFPFRILGSVVAKKGTVIFCQCPFLTISGNQVNGLEFFVSSRPRRPPVASDAPPHHNYLVIDAGKAQIPHCDGSAAGLANVPAEKRLILSPEFVVRSFILGAGVLRAPFTYESKTMTTGTVKFFNATRGFGFIEPEDGSKDAFVHISAVERAGLSSLSEGQKVSYELQPGQNGKTSAENLSIVE